MVVEEKRIYCDVCKDEIKSDRFLRKVNIPVNITDTYYNISDVIQTTPIDLCTDCYNKLYKLIKDQFANIENKDNTIIVR